MTDIIGVAATDDDALNRIFTCGLTIASILGRRDIDDEIAERLRDLLEQLDQTVSTLRRAALVRALNNRAAHCATPPSAEVGELRGTHLDGARRRLSRFAGETFAYARHGHDFYRASDHELWAHESDGLLLSARSGSPFARRDGHVFYDIESNVPLFYEDMHVGPTTSADQGPHLLE